MNRRARLDSCIERLQEFLADETNELGLAQRRSIAKKICRLKKLKKQTKLTHEELYRVVNEIAEAVSQMM